MTESPKPTLMAGLEVIHRFNLRRLNHFSSGLVSINIFILFLLIINII
jgi:hypothetical protein